MAKWIRLHAARCVRMATFRKPSPTRWIEAPTHKYFPGFREPLFSDKNNNVLKFVGFFCVLFSPTALFDLFFPMNLLYGVGVLSTLLAPTSTLPSDNHNAFFQIVAHTTSKGCYKCLCKCLHLCSCLHLPKRLLFTMVGNNLSPRPSRATKVQTSVKMSRELWEKAKFDQILRTNCLWKMFFYLFFMPWNFFLV